MAFKKQLVTSCKQAIWGEILGGNAPNYANNNSPKKIELKKGSVPITRSLPSLPISLFQDETKLEALFSSNIGIINITINDDTGLTVYQNIIDTSLDNKIEVDLTYFVNGNYTINFICGIIICGNFQI